MQVLSSLHHLAISLSLPPLYPVVFGNLHHVLGKVLQGANHDRHAIFLIRRPRFFPVLHLVPEIEVVQEDPAQVPRNR
jgi:hypothetical protein